MLAALIPRCLRAARVILLVGRVRLIGMVTAVTILLPVYQAYCTQCRRFLPPASADGYRKRSVIVAADALRIATGRELSLT